MVTNNTSQYFICQYKFLHLIYNSKLYLKNRKILPLNSNLENIIGI